MPLSEGQIVGIIFGAGFGGGLLLGACMILCWAVPFSIMYGEVMAATAFELAANTILPLEARDAGGKTGAFVNQPASIVQLLSNHTFVHDGFTDNPEALRLFLYMSSSAPPPMDGVVPTLATSLAKRNRRNRNPKNDAEALQSLDGQEYFITISLGIDKSLPLRAVIKSPNVSKKEALHLNGTEPVVMLDLAPPGGKTIKDLAFSRLVVSEARVHERVKSMMQQVSHYTTTMLPGMVDRVGPAAFRNAMAQVTVELYQDEIEMVAVKRRSRDETTHGSDERDYWAEKFAMFRDRMMQWEGEFLAAAAVN